MEVDCSASLQGASQLALPASDEEKISVDVQIRHFFALKLE